MASQLENLSIFSLWIWLLRYIGNDSRIQDYSLASILSILAMVWQYFWCSGGNAKKRLYPGSMIFTSVQMAIYCVFQKSVFSTTHWNTMLTPKCSLYCFSFKYERMNNALVTECWSLNFHNLCISSDIPSFLWEADIKSSQLSPSLILFTFTPA